MTAVLSIIGYIAWRMGTWPPAFATGASESVIVISKLAIFLISPSLQLHNAQVHQRAITGTVIDQCEKHRQVASDTNDAAQRPLVQRTLENRHVNPERW